MIFFGLWFGFSLVGFCGLMLFFVGVFFFVGCFLVLGFFLFGFFCLFGFGGWFFFFFFWRECWFEGFFVVGFERFWGFFGVHVLACLEEGDATSGSLHAMVKSTFYTLCRHLVPPKMNSAGV